MKFKSYVVAGFMFRSFLAGVVGMLISTIDVSLVEFGNSKLYPFPPVLAA